MSFGLSAYEFVVTPAEAVGFNFVEIVTVTGGTIGADPVVGMTFLSGGADLGEVGANPSGCLFTFNPNASFTFVFEPQIQVGFDFVDIPIAPGTIGTDAARGLSFLIGGLTLEELAGNVNGCLFPAITPIHNPPPQTGGGKTPRKCGNWWDECLHDKEDYIGVLDWGKVVEEIPRCYRNPDPNCDIPLTGQQFRRQAAVNLPPDDGTDYLLLEWAVPTGYSAIITDHTQLYTGNNFIEASGDLNWRMRIDTWWVKDMATMTTTLGSLNYLFPIPQGIVLGDGQTFRYYINVTVGAGIRITGGKIIAGINGWFYPSDELRRYGLPLNEKLLARYRHSQRYRERLENASNSTATYSHYAKP